MRQVTILLVTGALLVPGCSQISREQLAKEVLKVDPEFAAVLEKQQQLASRIQTYERELALKRQSIRQNIDQLRKELVSAAGNVRAKTDEVKRRMDPDRQRLQHDLVTASEEFRARQQQRASVGRRISELRKSMKGTAAAWTPAERADKQAELNELLQDTGRFDGEMAALKAHIRLLKIKLLLIKL